MKVLTLDFKLTDIKVEKEKVKVKPVKASYLYDDVYDISSNDKTPETYKEVLNLKEDIDIDKILIIPTEFVMNNKDFTSFLFVGSIKYSIRKDFKNNNLIFKLKDYIFNDFDIFIKELLKTNVKYNHLFYDYYYIPNNELKKAIKKLKIKKINNNYKIGKNIIRDYYTKKIIEEIQN